MGDRAGSEGRIDAALRHLRRSVHERRRRASQTEAETISAGTSPHRELATAIEYALTLQDVGQSVPSMSGSGTLRRKVGRLVVRSALSILREFTAEQRAFNRASIDALRQTRIVLDAHAADLALLHQELQASRSGPGRRSLAALHGSPAFDALKLNERFANVSAEADRRYDDYASRFSGRESVLDIACGTGRFLGACAKAGVGAYGVDLDGDMVERCRRNGFHVVMEDALGHLEGLPDASLGGAFSAQFVEHLSAFDLVEMLSLLHAKLEPGSSLLLETLNPECLQVIYRWFWLDPTHQRLVHPWLLEELLRATGFERIETHMLPPSDDSPHIPPLETPDADATASVLERFNRATGQLNELLFSSTDYYVVATR